MIKGSGFEVFHSRIFLGTKIQHAFWVQGDLIKRDLSTRWNLVNTQTKGACYGVCIFKAACIKGPVIIYRGGEGYYFFEKWLKKNMTLPFNMTKKL